MPKCKYCGERINLFQRHFGTYGEYCSQNCMDKKLQELEKDIDNLTGKMSESQIEEMKKRLGL